ncbi:MAG: methyltransferase domain-containing protein [Nitrospirae bacterium]|nr:methyltransferase domain-containing protein [Nitrospirota bacterium]
MKNTNTKAGESKRPGPDQMTSDGRKSFFGFYKTHRSRALIGFLRDVAKSETNNKTLSTYLGRRKRINCLIMGCSHWANPRDTTIFLKSFNNNLDINLAVLDTLPDALLECVQHNVDCLPLIIPAQKTPFLDDYFDIVVSDCLLTCCSFDQHDPVIREMSRVIKKNGIVLLGIAHSEQKVTFIMEERPIVNYCRPLADYKKFFGKYGFVFPPNSSVETRLPGKWSQIKIANGIVLCTKNGVSP